MDCKTVKMSAIPSQSAYFEDLSVHRPKIETIDSLPKEKVIAQNIVYQNQLKTKIDTALHVITLEKAKIKETEGYTIQLYRGDNREKAMQILNDMKINFTEESPLFAYKQPDFVVSVGQFHEKLEAYAFLGKIKDLFPNAFMIPCKIAQNYE